RRNLARRQHVEPQPRGDQAGAEAGETRGEAGYQRTDQHHGECRGGGKDEHRARFYKPRHLSPALLSERRSGLARVGDVLPPSASPLDADLFRSIIANRQLLEKYRFVCWSIWTMTTIRRPGSIVAPSRAGQAGDGQKSFTCSAGR